MDQPADKKPASGGARAVAAKHAARAAARKRGKWAEGWLAALEAIGNPPASPDAAHEWLGKLAVAIVHATVRDTAIPPEQMRRDAMKQIEQAQKAIGTAKLAAELRELYAALKDGQDAASEPGGDDPLCEEAPPLS